MSGAGRRCPTTTASHHAGPVLPRDAPAIIRSAAVAYAVIQASSIWSFQTDDSVRSVASSARPNGR